LSLQNISPSLETELCGEMNKLPKIFSNFNHCFF